MPGDIAIRDGALLIYCDKDYSTRELCYPPAANPKSLAVLQVLP